MAAIAWTDVVDHAAELSVVDAQAQTTILAMVNADDGVNVTHFGGEASAKTKLARIYLAAHHGKLTLMGESGAAGPVISERAGEVSRTYAQLSGSNSQLGLTIYGQSFALLARSMPAMMLL